MKSTRVGFLLNREVRVPESLRPTVLTSRNPLRLLTNGLGRRGPQRNAFAVMRDGTLKGQNLRVDVLKATTSGVPDKLTTYKTS